MAQNPFYVYALKDPRTTPIKPFYIGKGTGNRAWDHMANIDDSDKGNLIKDIIDSGNKVIHTIIADDLTETQALKIEAELISAFGVKSKGGFLTNRVIPSAENIIKRVKNNVPDGCYEKAQVALKMLKDALMEFAKANPGKLKNSDFAKYLGLQSNYAGASKDYLSYSIIGILMREGKMRRNADKTYDAVGD